MSAGAGVRAQPSHSPIAVTAVACLERLPPFALTLGQVWAPTQHTAMDRRLRAPSFRRTSLVGPTRSPSS